MFEKFLNKTSDTVLNKTYDTVLNIKIFKVMPQYLKSLQGHYAVY